MNDSLPEKSNIVILGGGSAGLALAFHLACHGIKNKSVTIVELRDQYKNDRTWCFWDFGELHQELRPVIRKQWDTWLFSHCSEKVSHQSDSHPYCAVSAGDYYQQVLFRLQQEEGVKVVKGCKVISVIPYELGHIIETSHGKIIADQVIDTRPPIIDYFHRDKMTSKPEFSPDFTGSLLYQIFYGIEVETDTDTFDDTTVHLMTEMNQHHEGLSFRYILPYTKRRALIEYTTFTPLFFKSEQLRSHCFTSIEQFLGEQPYKTNLEEGAVLPMGFQGIKSKGKNLLHAGIAGGSVRDSTGYSFIRTQRWAADCSSKLLEGKIPNSMNCDSTLDEYLDHVFLKVIRKNPQLAPTLFMKMAKSLSADSFARFMMEKGQWSDYAKVILSMPKKPFIQQILPGN